VFRAGLIECARSRRHSRCCCCDCSGADDWGCRLAAEAKYVQTGCEISEAYFATFTWLPKRTKANPTRVNTASNSIRAY
jgi:hypothetical protein